MSALQTRVLPAGDVLHQVRRYLPPQVHGAASGVQYRCFICRVALACCSHNAAAAHAVQVACAAAPHPLLTRPSSVFGSPLHAQVCTLLPRGCVRLRIHCTPQLDAFVTAVLGNQLLFPLASLMLAVAGLARRRTRHCSALDQSHRATWPAS